MVSGIPYGQTYCGGIARKREVIAHWGAKHPSPRWCGVTAGLMWRVEIQLPTAIETGLAEHPWPQDWPDVDDFNTEKLNADLDHFSYVENCADTK